jgi:hypothetical protein
MLMRGPDRGLQKECCKIQRRRLDCFGLNKSKVEVSPHVMGCATAFT